MGSRAGARVESRDFGPSIDQGIRRVPLRSRDDGRGPGSRAYGSDSGYSRTGGSARATSPSTIVNKRTNDPGAGPARRARSSPWPKVAVEDALRRISRSAVPLPPKSVKTFLPSMRPADATANDVDYVLATDVRAEVSSPAFRTSMVDGYAIRLGDGDPRGGKFSVVSTPGVPMRIRLDRGQVARVSTGQSLSSDVDAVVMVEDTVVTESASGGREEARIRIFDDAIEIRRGDNVREVGSDCRRDDVILRKGDYISAGGGELALICAAGVENLRVYPQPKITVIDIIQDYASKAPDGMQTANERLIQALLTESGITRGRLDCSAMLGPRAFADSHAPRNNTSEIEQALEEALKSDVIITTGGVSMGEDDFVKPIIERTFRGKIHFGRVDMKPGMPTTFATIRSPRSGDPDRLVFCLPEHPASIIAAFSVLVIPALHRLMGKSPRECGFPRVPVLLEDRDVKADERRTSFHRAMVVARSDGRLHARSAGEQGRPFVTPRNVGANALLCIPPGEHARPGNEVLALITRPIRSEVEFSTAPETEKPMGVDKYWPS